MAGHCLMMIRMERNCRSAAFSEWLPVCLMDTSPLGSVLSSTMIRKILTKQDYVEDAAMCAAGGRRLL
jgi:hypothetical protein